MSAYVQDDKSSSSIDKVDVEKGDDVLINSMPMDVVDDPNCMSCLSMSCPVY